MSENFPDNSTVRPLLAVGGIAIAMSPLAQLHPWIAACGTFLVMTIVVAFVALSGNARATGLVYFVAVMLGSGVCWYCGSDLSWSLALFVSLLGTATLGTLSAGLCKASRRRLQKINDLEAQQFELVRRVYDNGRSTCQSGEIPVLGANRAPEVSPMTADHAQTAIGQLPLELVESSTSQVINPDTFDFAMLLLSMQQIGHRLSSELKLDALVSEILRTAKEVLRCQHAELHLWNACDKRFTNAVQSEAMQISDSVAAVLTRAAPIPAAFEWVIRYRRILTQRDAQAGKLEDADFSGAALPSAISPLLVGDELVGVLVVNEAEDEGPTFIRMLHILANHCAMSLKNSQLFRTIQEMARRDGLTGLLNHAPFLDELERLIDEAQQQNRPLTLVMCDLDYFKDFNDNYGHQAGDKVLQEVAQWWRAIMPDHAILARYGGEEFICALPGESLNRGTELAEMLRSALIQHPVSYNGITMRVTASFGVAELGHPATNATRLIRLADKALYRAKDDGRNCVEAHDPSRPEIALMAETSQFSLRQDS